MKTWVNKLQKMNACEEAVKWCDKGSYKTLQEAWESCDNVLWMMWLIEHTIKPNADTKPLILIACECGRTSLKYARQEDVGVLTHTYGTAEAYTKGETTIQQVRAAGSAAWSAAWSARSAAGPAGSAAWSARSAAWSARSAAWSAGSADR